MSDQTSCLQSWSLKLSGLRASPSRWNAVKDWLLNIVVVGLNSCVLMTQAAALNVVVNSQDSGVLWTLLISNNYTVCLFGYSAESIPLQAYTCTFEF